MISISFYFSQPNKCNMASLRQAVPTVIPKYPYDIAGHKKTCAVL